MQGEWVLWDRRLMLRLETPSRAVAVISRRSAETLDVLVLHSPPSDVVELCDPFERTRRGRLHESPGGILSLDGEPITCVEAFKLEKILKADGYAAAACVRPMRLCLGRELIDAIANPFISANMIASVRVLLAATEVGTDVSAIAKCVELPVAEVEAISRRFRSSGIFVGSEVLATWHVPTENSLLGLMLDAMVGAGELVRQGGAERAPKYAVTVGGPVRSSSRLRSNRASTGNR